MYWVYIIQSEQTKNFYIGHTNNLDRRLKQHNEGKNKWTKNKGPWKIVYTEKFKTKSEAIKREKFLKRQKNRKFYEKLIGVWRRG